MQKQTIKRTRNHRKETWENEKHTTETDNQTDM